VNRVVNTVRRWLPPESLLGAARLISERNQKCRHVFAVASVARCECRARASGDEARGRELERYPVRFGFVSAYVSTRPGVFDDDVFDGTSAHVVVTPQIRARSQ
jgi:hypothetical protein